MGQRKYPPLTPSEVEAIATSLGFAHKNQVGSHRSYERLASNGRPRAIITIDMGEDDFNEFLIKSMIHQSTFTREQFYGATKRTASKASVKRFKLSAAPEQE